MSHFDNPYFTLLVRYDGKGPWRIEFGDFQRETTESERDAYKDDGHRCKIIVTEYTDGQPEVDRKVAQANGGTS